MIRMVTPVCVSLLASLFVALVLVPMTQRPGPRGTPTRCAAAARWRAAAGGRRLVEGVDGPHVHGHARAGQRVVRGRCCASLRRRIDVGHAVAADARWRPARSPMQHVKFSSGENMGTRNFWANYPMPSDVTRPRRPRQFFRDVETSDRGGQGRVPDRRASTSASTAASPRCRCSSSRRRPASARSTRSRQEVYDKMPNQPGWVKEARFGEAERRAGQHASWSRCTATTTTRCRRPARRCRRRCCSSRGWSGCRTAAPTRCGRDELALAVDPDDDRAVRHPGRQHRQLDRLCDPRAGAAAVPERHRRPRDRGPDPLPQGGPRTARRAARVQGPEREEAGLGGAGAGADRDDGAEGRAGAGPQRQAGRGDDPARARGRRSAGDRGPAAQVHRRLPPAGRRSASTPTRRRARPTTCATTWSGR